MNARTFLLRGLLAGLIAGLATFFVAHQVGEPHVESAIALEEAGAAAEPTAQHPHDQGQAADDRTPGDSEEAGTQVSRANQRTWGLLTGTLSMGVALGGLVALVAAATLGRIGRLMPGQSTALIALLGFLSSALVPFFKYPATPPAVGNGDTIGDRTALYFGFVLVSVAAAVLATYGAVKVQERIGAYGGVVAGVAGYLIVVVIAGQRFATIDETGAFPAGTLWAFRSASLITLATMWGVLGVVLTGLVLRLHGRAVAASQRRELAASL